jgi:hypothetical protein
LAKTTASKGGSMSVADELMEAAGAASEDVNWRCIGFDVSSCNPPVAQFWASRLGAYNGLCYRAGLRRGARFQRINPMQSKFTPQPAMWSKYKKSATALRDAVINGHAKIAFAKAPIPPTPPSEWH